jgi:hypothetical protein
MKTAMMWIINYFFAYEMVSEWIIHEKLACPIVWEKKKVFTLTNDSKTSLFFIIIGGFC